MLGLAYMTGGGTWRWHALAATALLTTVFTMPATAASPSANRGASRPSITITSVKLYHHCITVNVKIFDFKLVAPPQTPTDRVQKLKGNEGHIRYHLSSTTGAYTSHDASIKLSHTWCGRAEGVRRGTNIVQVYLVTGVETLFPGTEPVIREVTVR